MIDYLREFYDVEVLYNKSEEINENSDLSQIDDSYKAVIFWQLFPIENLHEKIKHDNIIFFPMYDLSSNWNFEKWLSFKNIKIINFSKILHKKLKSTGFNSIYLQYFIKPEEFSTGNKNEVFFWQRHSEPNFETIKKILPEENVKIHMHKSVDPTHEFVTPSPEDEIKYEITYSSWFENKQEMTDLIKSKAMYIAPRLQEGVGMSFLEAMAQGKAVIAHDAPTMNEYIINGKTGYLCNFNNPVKINFSNIEQVKKNAYEYMKKGYDTWINGRKNIIDFIEQPAKKNCLTVFQKVKIFFIFADKKDMVRLKFGTNGYFKMFGIYLINKQQIN
jgi:glycosyltransferase involved in cell wall biosynthesis